MNPSKLRDHGGGLDAAVVRFGGLKANWLDLSTGINPVPYPIPLVDAESWQVLPDQDASKRLEIAARKFWNIPDRVSILAAPGASSLIARIPALFPAGTVDIPGPTYNEHAAAFSAQGWQISSDQASARVVVHPNNPDGRYWDDLKPAQSLTIIDESFCDIAPERTLINLSKQPGVVILKSFGKFWGLAGLRLGFAIGDPELITKLAESLGPWPVSGPALAIGASALNDPDWANATRERLVTDARQLDTLMTAKGAKIIGCTPLFRLYQIDDAAQWQTRLAQAHIWSRIFPYSDSWLRLGVPDASGLSRVTAAL